MIERAAAADWEAMRAICGERPRGFYSKLGYEELGRVAAGERFIFALGKRLG